MLKSTKRALHDPIYTSNAEVVKKLESGQLPTWSVGWFLRSNE
jgi:hypothetical protein